MINLQTLKDQIYHRGEALTFLFVLYGPSNAVLPTTSYALQVQDIDPGMLGDKNSKRIENTHANQYCYFQFL